MDRESTVRVVIYSGEQDDDGNRFGTLSEVPARAAFPGHKASFFGTIERMAWPKEHSLNLGTKVWLDGIGEAK